jgi:hypothetical protein
MRHDPGVRAIRAASLACVALLLGACATMQSEPAGRSAAAQPATAEMQGAAALASTLDLLQRLIQGGPAEQAEALAAARRAFEDSPRGSAQLRYALALSAPGHPAREPATAQRLLRELLAAPETLTPVERSMALVELQRVDTELRLVAENVRLAAEASRERNRDRGTAANAALNRRLQTEIDENARLRKALDEARAKLDAIATIEQNITERKPTTEGRRP